MMSLLAAAPELSFADLKEQLQMTDGNLSMHIKTLQEAGYVAVAKTYRNRRPWTTVSLTPEGRNAFTRYIDLLEQIVRQTRKP